MRENKNRILYLLVIILFANFLVSAVKIIIGKYTGSASIAADGFHSSADGASNIVGIIGILIASRPSDHCHPYGHQKFEVLSCLFIGIMLGYLSVTVAITGINGLIDAKRIIFGFTEIIAIIATIGINIIVSFTEYKLGKRWGSSVLVADSIHTKSDILISSGVLVGVIGIKLGLPPQIDGIVSLFISVCIAFSCIEIMKPAIKTLVDGKAVDCNEISTIVMSFTQVKGVHKIRSRAVQNEIFIDMHILINSDASVTDSHSLSHGIENALQEHLGRNTQVIIHIEPYLDLCQ